MSYDLNFWQYEDNVYLDNQDVYEKLSNGELVEGVVNIPVSEILKRLKDYFSDGWEQLDELNWESEKGAFQIFTTQQLFRVDCYDMDGEEMNKVIDIANEFHLPLYDPQVGKRYDGR
ncbi:MAG: hypothetical protein JRJ85_23940 [Deltaproteobacteria bacterium]|nr:hypothetical protein [Deltaproteobacteria bacterium]